MKAKSSKKRSPARPRAKAADILPTPTAPASAVPSHWRWHQHVLLNLQGRLLQRRDDSLKAASEPLETHGMDEADSATDEFDHALALTQLAAEEDALHEVNSALQRIYQGTYGVCEDTGKMIPDARLRAIPWTRYTLKAARQREKDKLLRPPPP